MAVAAKAQQEPQDPWSLTYVTFPKLFQLSEDGAETLILLDVFDLKAFEALRFFKSIFRGGSYFAS